jgi:hypothetical protein
MHHLRALLLLSLVISGCGASSPSEAESSAGSEQSTTPSPEPVALTCAGDPPSDFAPLRRDCTVDADCAVVRHRLDCCGSYTRLGIRADERATFDAAEAACEPTVAMCRCMARPDVASDGTHQEEGLTVAVRCVERACETSFSP